MKSPKKCSLCFEDTKFPIGSVEKNSCSWEKWAIMFVQWFLLFYKETKKVKRFIFELSLQTSCHYYIS
jgi:hypothetical protein